MDFDNFLAISSEAERCLNTKDLSEIVKASLLLCNTLLDCKDLTTYFRFHTNIFSYLTNLDQALSDKKIFNQKELKQGYFMSLQCNILIPRAYVAFFFAKAMNSKYYMDMALDMIDMIGKPLHAIVLRYTVVSFLPKDMPTYWDFIKKNYSAMLYFFDNLGDDFERRDHIADIVLVNIAVVANLEDNSEILRFLLHEAKQYQNSCITDKVFKAVIPLIPKDMNKENYDAIRDFLNSTEQSTDKLKQVYQMIESTDDIEEMFNFVLTLNCADACKDRLAKRAIHTNNMSVLRQCAHKWPTDSILRKFFEFAGFEEFTKDMPTPMHNSQFTAWFITSYYEYLTPEQIRHLIGEEMMKRCADIEDALLLVAKKGFEVGKIVFAAPFSFNSREMLELSLQGAKSKNDVIDFVARSPFIQNDEKVDIIRNIIPEESEFILSLDNSQEKEISSLLDNRLTTKVEDMITYSIKLLSLRKNRGNNTEKLEEDIIKYIKTIKMYPSFAAVSPDVLKTWKSLTCDDEKFGNVAKEVQSLA